MVAGICLSGCYYDSEEELYGAGSCDTSHITYSTTITGIINNYGCLTCHSGVAPVAGFTLESYSDVKAKVLDNRLLGAINHDPGFAPMPQNLPKMSDCDITKVRLWIEAGAPNN
jgi:hypothetical protein